MWGSPVLLTQISWIFGERATHPGRFHRSFHQTQALNAGGSVRPGPEDTPMDGSIMGIWTPPPCCPPLLPSPASIQLLPGAYAEIKSQKGRELKSHHPPPPSGISITGKNSTCLMSTLWAFLNFRVCRIMPIDGEMESITFSCWIPRLFGCPP